jgi:hypothetical protein
MRFSVILLLCSHTHLLFPQTFWTETFATGAGWTLANVTGTEGSDPNFFTISSAEGGNITPNMGAPTSCGVFSNGNNTMHVTSVFNPGGGAAYDAGGLCGFWYCPQTNRRAQSPVINCTGRSTITVTFSYIEGGQTTLDNATLWYFNGTTWAQIDDMPKTLTGCGGQGLWVTRSIALPVSANNNANVRIGYRWVNNDDGAGTDPSFAVDNIALSTPTLLPVELVSFDAEAEEKSIQLSWSSYITAGFDGFAIEKSTDGSSFVQIAYVRGTTLSRGKSYYSFRDEEIKANANYYYRLRCTEEDGSFKFSEIKSARVLSYDRDIKAYYNGSSVVVTGAIADFAKMELLDVTGKTIRTEELKSGSEGGKISAESLEKGIYFLRIGNLKENRTLKVTVW